MKNIELEDSDLEELDYLMVDIEKKSNILCPNPYLLGLAFIIFISSIIICFFSLTVGLATMVTAFLITYLSCKFRRSLNFDTIRELIQNITENNYLYIRKETNTVNETEVKNIIRKWLSETIGYKMKGDEEISFSLKTK